MGYRYTELLKDLKEITGEGGYFPGMRSGFRRTLVQTINELSVLKNKTETTGTVNRRKFRFSFIFLFVFIFPFAGVNAQSWDFGAFLGGSGYMGDLNPVKPLEVNNLAYGILVKRSFDPYWSLKFNLQHGKIEADDKNSDNSHFRERNLGFFSPVTEISLQAEFNFLKYIPSISRNRFTPYLFAGIGMVSFNPKVEIDGETYVLYKYGTEGQSLSKPYKRSAISVPYGAGVKYNIWGKWTLGGELGYRTAHTDYLDDVSGKYPYPAQLASDNSQYLSEIRQGLADRSLNQTGVPGTQRGDYRKKDTYLFMGLSITYSLFSDKCPVVD